MIPSQQFNTMCSEHKNREIVGTCFDQECKSNRRNCHECLKNQKIKHSYIVDNGSLEKTIEEICTVSSKIIYEYEQIVNDILTGLRQIEKMSLAKFCGMRIYLDRQKKELGGSCNEHSQKNIIMTCNFKDCVFNKYLCVVCFQRHANHATQLMNAQDFINLNEEVYKKIQNELLHINQLTENLDAQMKKFIVNLKNTFIFSYQQLQFLNNETINNTITSILRFNRRKDILNKKFIKFTKLQKGTLKELQNKISSDYQFVIFYVDYQNKNPLNQQEIPRGNQLGQLRQSIECYEEAIKINPRNDHAWSSKGDCLRLLQKYEESIICYNQALSINPKNELSLCGKGDSLRILGQNSQQRNYQEKESQNQAVEVDQKQI